MADLVPLEGTFFVPEKSEEQQAKLNKEKAETLQVMPFIEDSVQWFDKQAKEFEKLTNIDLTSKVPAESQILAYQMVTKLMQAKKGEFITLVAAYKK